MHREYGLSLEPEMERCTLCNSIIRNVGSFETDILKTKDYVYPERLEKGKEFWICDNCDQVYWQGSHWKNILERINDMRKSA